MLRLKDILGDSRGQQWWEENKGRYSDELLEVVDQIIAETPATEGAFGPIC